jgi:restriction system protein
MGRRNQSAIVGAVIVTSKLLWWVSILMAIIIYLIFNYVAITHNQLLTDMQHIGQFAGNQLFPYLSFFGKFLVPFIFIVGSIVSFFNGLRVPL